MPAYSQSTIRTRAPSWRKFAVSRSLWQATRSCSAPLSALRIASAPSASSPYTSGIRAPRSAAVARYSSTTAKESKRDGSAGPACTVRSTSATSSTSGGARSSSAASGRPAMNAVTRHGGSSMNATTSGPTPARAAASVASRSAARSIPSRSVSLPGSRTTTSRPPSSMRKLRFVMPPSSACGSDARAPSCGSSDASAASSSASTGEHVLWDDVDVEAGAVAAVAVAGELDRGAVARVGDPHDEHQRRPLGDAERAGLVGARGDRLQPLGGADRREVVALAHQRVERAGEVEVEQAGEALGRHPRVLQRQRLVAAEAHALEPYHPRAGGEGERVRDVGGRPLLGGGEDARPRFEPLALDVLGEAGDAREVVHDRRRLAREGAAADAALDEAARRERGERLAHGHAAHAERKREVALGREPLAGRDPAGVDAVGELLLDLDPGRLGRALGDVPATADDSLGSGHWSRPYGNGRDLVNALSLRHRSSVAPGLGLLSAPFGGYVPRPWHPYRSKSCAPRSTPGAWTPFCCASPTCRAASRASGCSRATSSTTSSSTARRPATTCSPSTSR